VDSGVPQWPVLRPILFIIHINDLDLGINNNISKFADDKKVGRIINPTDDEAALQKDLDVLFKWSSNWQIKLNLDKCKILRVGNPLLDIRYKLDNLEIRILGCERDLGVLVIKDLRIREQCINVCNKANRILGFTSRSVSNRTSNIILQLYLALVRPHLDYAMQFWSPQFRMDISSLETIKEG